MRGLVVITIISILLIASPSSSCARQYAQARNTFNVLDYGAVGNGQTDDSQAFLKAWWDVCGVSGGMPTLLIPMRKTFMLQPVVFQGPCKSNTIGFQIEGTIVAPSKSAWRSNQQDNWIQFSNINGLIINGGGQIDGQGASWWGSSLKDRPTALFIHNCNGSQLSEIKHVNSPRNHISINGCNGFYVSNLQITAPGESPNTDGIDISSCSNINIDNSFIGTGDDCIAINSGSSNINITNVTCGPGHGISIGSLGANGQYATVEEVQVRDCHFKGTQNGVRIKTWEGGSGYARKISFERITLEDTQNPIIIDQYYFSNGRNPKKSSVLVSDVTYREVNGYSSDEKAIVLNCSPSGCRNLVLDSINITVSVPAPGKKSYAVCYNAYGTATSVTPTVPCL